MPLYRFFKVIDALEEDRQTYDRVNLYLFSSFLLLCSYNEFKFVCFNGDLLKSSKFLDLLIVDK